jgi:CxxC-x17-CxxC domain-containing protein
MSDTTPIIFGRKRYPIQCTNCGKDDTVPFLPDQSRPVYCRECFAKLRNRQL